MRTAIRRIVLAVVVTALAGLAGATLTATSVLAGDLLIGEVIPAAAALTAGGLHLAVATLLTPAPDRSRIAVRRTGPAPTGASRAVGRAAVLAGAQAT